MMHAARARLRRWQIRAHRDMQFGGRTALAHLIDMHHIGIGIRHRIIAHVPHDMRSRSTMSVGATSGTVMVIGPSPRI